MVNFVTGARGQKRLIQDLKPTRCMNMLLPSSFSSTYSTAVRRVSHTTSSTHNILTPLRPHTWQLLAPESMGAGCFRTFEKRGGAEDKEEQSRRRCHPSEQSCIESWLRQSCEKPCSDSASPGRLRCHFSSGSGARCCPPSHHGSFFLPLPPPPPLLLCGRQGAAWKAVG